MNKSRNHLPYSSIW